MRLEVEYDRQAYDTILRWTMPRFEDLLDGQGRIRLVTDVPPPRILGFVGSVCRGWRLHHSGSESVLEPSGCRRWRYKFEFRRVQQTQFAGGDFDAMLAALEPYEVVRKTPQCPVCGIPECVGCLPPSPEHPYGFGPVVGKPVIHYAPYGPNAIGGFDCGNKSDRNNLFTGHPRHVTCDGCKRASPGLWPEVVEADTPLEVRR